VDRVKKAFFTNLCVTWAITLPFVIAYFFFGDTMINIFAKDLSPEALKAGVTYIKIVAPFMLIIAVKTNCDSVLKGSAKMVHFLISTASDLVLRVALAYLLSSFMDELGIWWAWPIGWVLATLISACFYYSGLWYKPKKQRNKKTKINARA